MSADNIVVIQKQDDGVFRAYHRGASAYDEGQYDYEGECIYCDGKGNMPKVIPDGKCLFCGGTGYYKPPKEIPIFEAGSAEDAICKYHKWLEEDGGYVEYGYTFEGIGKADG